jgi:hypothetical protein
MRREASNRLALNIAIPRAWPKNSLTLTVCAGDITRLQLPRMANKFCTMRTLFSRNKTASLAVTNPVFHVRESGIVKFIVLREWDHRALGLELDWCMIQLNTARSISVASDME